MLPAEHRLRHAAQFSGALRRGRRASRPSMSVHLLLPEPDRGHDVPTRAGLVVSKAVGNAVVRHRTSRRLRHLLRPWVLGPTALPAGSTLVVRANPAAGTAPSSVLAADLAAALTSALAKARA